MVGPRRRTGVRFRARVAAALFCAGLFSSCRQPPAIDADVAVRIDGEEVSYGEFEAYLRDNADSGDGALESELQSRLFDQFLDEQLILRLAIERGMVEPGADQRQALGFLLRAHPTPVWPQSQLRAYYLAHKADFQRPEEVHLRQILVADRAAAEQARQAILNGEEFAAVAARFSQAPNAQLGGDQGRLSRDDLPAAYADVIFSLAPGAVSDVVPVDYGFHLFEVVARYPAELAPMEEVAGEIRRALERQRIDELVESFIHEARERYNVTVFPANFPFDYRGDYVHGDTADATPIDED